MRISMLGTRGVPACYGGFETAVEEVGARLVERGHSVVVYCRNSDQTLVTYRGMELRNVAALHLKVAETLSHTAFSLRHVMRERPEVALVFNMANSPLLPALAASGVPVALHVDGMEWQRGKWDGLGRHYYRFAERLGVRLADALIADSGGIADYYRQQYRVSAWKIAYGAEIRSPIPDGELPIAGVFARQYHLIVSRWVPENNLSMILSGYAASSAQFPLLVVGDASYGGRHAEHLRDLAASDYRIRLLGSIYEQNLLNTLYGGALTYLHGHSVGGTNPSLLRAMGSAAPVIAYDVVFNREVLADTGVYFREPLEIARHVEMAEADAMGACARGLAGQSRASTRYNWESVTSQYELLCESLKGLKGRGPGELAETARVRRRGRRLVGNK